MSTPGSVPVANEFIHSLGSNNIVSEPRWFMILKCLDDSAHASIRLVNVMAYDGSTLQLGGSDHELNPILLSVVASTNIVSYSRYASNCGICFELLFHTIREDTNNPFDFSYFMTKIEDWKRIQEFKSDAQSHSHTLTISIQETELLSDILVLARSFEVADMLKFVSIHRIAPL